MGAVTKISLLIGLLSAGFGVFQIKNIFQVPPVPNLPETWWGPGKPGVDDKTIRPFKINVPDDVLLDLKNRLKNTKPPAPPLSGAHQTYGLNSQATKKYLDFWLNKYDWRKREQFLNQYPQFKTQIQGLDIHFLHIKPKTQKGLKVVPILLVHGWPVSVRDFYEMIPLLTTPQKGRDFVYEVIVPSLPGYGFSDATSRPGLGAAQIAVIFKNLMNRLGIQRYYVHGGDWGAVVVSDMSILFPKNVIGLHSTMCSDMSPIAVLKKLVYGLKPSLIVEEKYEHLVYPVSNFFVKLIEEFGYFHLQATRPDSVGAALTDSPAGLATYILDKFVHFSNPEWKNLEDGGLSKYNTESLIDNIMIYWASGSISTSIRLYAENMSSKNRHLKLDNIPIEVPTGCSRFIYDLVYTPTALLENRFPKLVHVTDHDGGHFPGYEQPEVFVNDIYEFTERVEKVRT